MTSAGEQPLHHINVYYRNNFLKGLLIDLFHVLVFRSVLASDSVFEATKVARVCINNVKERVPFGHICIGHYWAIMANFRSGVVSFLGSWNSWLGIGEYRNLYIFKIWSTHAIFVSTMDYFKSQKGETGYLGQIQGLDKKPLFVFFTASIFVLCTV